MRRHYSHCAKCGRPKESGQAFVGACCVHTPGLYTHCAVDGAPMGEASRCYVCEDHLVQREEVRPAI